MCIPYGALLLAGGLAGKLCGWGQPAAVMAVLGAAQVVLSNLSLRAWRAGKATTPITLSEAGKRSCAAWCPLCSVPRLAPHLPRWLLVPCLTANLIAFRTAHAPTSPSSPRHHPHTSLLPPCSAPPAGLAGWLAYYAYRAVQQGVSRMFMGALLGLSAAMALFLVYNVVAGGNPPRRGPQAAAVAAEAAAAAEPEPAATS